jgi:hypothetical protein
MGSPNSGASRALDYIPGNGVHDIHMNQGNDASHAGETLRVTLSKNVQLSNKGGTITLLNAHANKVDGVSYTQEQASHGGWTVAF